MKTEKGKGKKVSFSPGLIKGPSSCLHDSEASTSGTAAESTDSGFLGQRLIRKQSLSRSVVVVRSSCLHQNQRPYRAETRRKSCMKVDLASRWSLIEGITVGRDGEAKRCLWSEMSREFSTGG
ncbi:hypothetical protein F2Q69_00023581 [Brassica cretica]|uniref:Uncharacterized protein n=1 Tax=Brassica cretica TaxID=69181 RepID=A0A8S9QJN6_BRACR|nr:hypothetical protein F2Q69_00023581 [Brassica cretica]